MRSRREGADECGPGDEVRRAIVADEGSRADRLQPVLVEGADEQACLVTGEDGVPGCGSGLLVRLAFVAREVRDIWNSARSHRTGARHGGRR